MLSNRFREKGHDNKYNSELYLIEPINCFIGENRDNEIL
jgi:hypothetical protein